MGCVVWNEVEPLSYLHRFIFPAGIFFMLSLVWERKCTGLN